MRVECGSGESRVNEAVEVRRWKVASVMNRGGGGSRLGSSSEGGGGGLRWSGGEGGCSWGVGMVMGKRERARPRDGLEGMLAEWVVRVMVVLKPAV